MWPSFSLPNVNRIKFHNFNSLVLARHVEEGATKKIIQFVLEAHWKRQKSINTPPYNWARKWIELLPDDCLRRVASIKF